MASSEASYVGSQLDEHHAPETNGRMSVCRRCGTSTDGPVVGTTTPVSASCLGRPNGWWPRNVSSTSTGRRSCAPVATDRRRSARYRVVDFRPGQRRHWASVARPAAPAQRHDWVVDAVGHTGTVQGLNGPPPLGADGAGVDQLSLLHPARRRSPGRWRCDRRGRQHDQRLPPVTACPGSAPDAVLWRSGQRRRGTVAVRGDSLPGVDVRVMRVPAAPPGSCVRWF